MLCRVFCDYVSDYCPTRPATSNMDIALRTTGILPHRGGTRGRSVLVPSALQLVG
jgi:hypothetical protein